MQVYGIDTMVRLFSHFAFIYLVFWSLRASRLDLLFKKGIQYDRQIRVFYTLFAVAIGYMSSQFFLDVIFSVRNFFEGIFLIT